MIELFKKKYHRFVGEKYLGKLELDFSSKKNRLEIIQILINLKKFKSYLEIGTYKNEVFANIVCEKNRCRSSEW